VCWGTDALWTGAPQWQIEGLRRLEISDAMQKKHGFAPLGPADGPVKTAIFGGNNAKLYDVQPKRAMLELSREWAFKRLTAEGDMIEDGARTEREGRKRLTSLFHEVDLHSAN
jgi:hypothetical protein